MGSASRTPSHLPPSSLKCPSTDFGNVLPRPGAHALPGASRSNARELITPQFLCRPFPSLHTDIAAWPRHQDATPRRDTKTRHKTRYDTSTGHPPTLQQLISLAKYIRVTSERETKVYADGQSERYRSEVITTVSVQNTAKIISLCV